MTPAEIKALRKQLALSQDAFARELGVSVNTVRRWEYGDRHPSSLARREIERLIKNWPKTGPENA